MEYYSWDYPSEAVQEVKRCMVALRIIIVLGILLTSVPVIAHLFEYQLPPWQLIHAVLALILLVQACVCYLLFRRCARVAFESHISRVQARDHISRKSWPAGLFVRLWSDTSDPGLRLLSGLQASFLIGIMVLGLALTSDSSFAASSAFALFLMFTYLTHRWSGMARRLADGDHDAQLRAMYISWLGVRSLPFDRSFSVATLNNRKPICFLSYRGAQKKQAAALAESLMGAGCDVEMYDPDRLWQDAPLEIQRRLSEQADCLVYFDTADRESPWVRVEHSWARYNGRPILCISSQPSVQQLEQIRRATRLPRESGWVQLIDAVFLGRRRATWEVLMRRQLNKQAWTKSRSMGSFFMDLELFAFDRAKFARLCATTLFISFIAFLCVYYFVSGPGRVWALAGCVLAAIVAIFISYVTASFGAPPKPSSPDCASKDGAVQ